MRALRVSCFRRRDGDYPDGGFPAARIGRAVIRAVRDLAVAAGLTVWGAALLSSGF